MLFNHFLVRIITPVYHVRMGSTRMRAPKWAASGMGHWKRLIKISDGTDCYYCINNMTCSIYVYFYSVVHVTISNILFSIMSSVYLVTLTDTCYTSCGDTLFMYTYTLHSMYSFSYTLQTLLLYNLNTVVWIFCILHIYMFIFITISLYYCYY